MRLLVLPKCTFGPKGFLAERADVFPFMPGTFLLLGASRWRRTGGLRAADLRLCGRRFYRVRVVHCLYVLVQTRRGLEELLAGSARDRLFLLLHHENFLPGKVGKRFAGGETGEGCNRKCEN